MSVVGQLKERLSGTLTKGYKLAEQGHYNEAIKEYNKAIELNPKMHAAYYNRAWAYKLQGKKTEALADFEKFISLTDNPQLIEAARQQIEELNE